MTSILFEGSSLLLQGDLLHDPVDDVILDIDPWEVRLDHLASSIRQAFAFHDYEGALLVIELDELDESLRQVVLLDRIVELARTSIRKSDILEKLDTRTIVVALPGCGRIGMTRVADAIRQRAWAASMEINGDMQTTVTIGAVHTTEAALVEVDDLLLAARVNLDAARAAGGNRTNWSDWTELP